jgi:hypothetical protein
MSKRTILTAIFAATLAASASHAQLLGGGLGLPGPVGGVIGGIGNTVDRTVGNVTGRPDNPSSYVNPSNPVSLDAVRAPLRTISAAAPLLSDIRKARLAALIRANRNTLDRDGDGQPVRKGELVVTDPDPASLALAQRAGFRIARDEQAGDLGIRMVTLSPPRHMDVRQGLKALRKAAPRLQADYNHIYEPAGGALLPAAAATIAASPVRAGTRIAMIDGGVASHPSLARAGIEQRGFNGPARPTGHGTAVGSLLVGDQGPFHGAARGAQLFVGDVYGGNPAAGSATAIVRALAWAASKKPSVINISLVGPANRTLAKAVNALRARGIALVAAVGNDGPAAPAQYPASYPGVIAVTGVDGSNRALREAGRATHLDFAAPGADLAAALPGKGYTEVRGTSFAAPFVAARLAATGSAARLAAEARPGKGRVGRGIICGSCDIAPRAVGLK